MTPVSPTVAPTPTALQRSLLVQQSGAGRSAPSPLNNRGSEAGQRNPSAARALAPLVRTPGTDRRRKGVDDSEEEEEREEGGDDDDDDDGLGNGRTAWAHPTHASEPHTVLPNN